MTVLNCQKCGKILGAEERVETFQCPECNSNMVVVDNLKWPKNRRINIITREQIEAFKRTLKVANPVNTGIFVKTATGVTRKKHVNIKVEVTENPVEKLSEKNISRQESDDYQETKANLKSNAVQVFKLSKTSKNTSVPQIDSNQTDWPNENDNGQALQLKIDGETQLKTGTELKRTHKTVNNLSPEPSTESRNTALIKHIENGIEPEIPFLDFDRKSILLVISCICIVMALIVTALLLFRTSHKESVPLAKQEDNLISENKNTLNENKSEIPLAYHGKPDYQVVKKYGNTIIIPESEPIFDREKHSDKLVDINTASIQEIETIRGIGPKTAQKIIDGRPYSDISEIRKIPGIGEKKYDTLKDFITVRKNSNGK